MKKYNSALIVDDALFMREVIKDGLTPLFEKIYDAQTPEGAIKIIKKEQPDLITLDMSLNSDVPMQGLDILKKIKDTGYKSSIVVISAINQNWLKEELIKAGIDGYINKPFGEDELKTVVALAMEVGHAGIK